MKKDRLIIIALALVLILPGMISCENDTPSQPEPAPEDTTSPAHVEPDFNIIFKYGITAGNELDTFQGTYTRDMVADPPVTIELSLSGEEKDSIYQKMLEIDFLNYPDEFSVSAPPDVSVGIRTPFSSYYFRVQYESRTKELSWGDEKVFKDYTDERAEKLRELITLIRTIVESKEEYKKLPEPITAYQ